MAPRKKHSKSDSKQTRFVEDDHRQHPIHQKSNPAPQETRVTQPRALNISGDTRQSTISPGSPPGLAVNVAPTLVNCALNYVNFLIFKSPVRLFEFCDLEIMPGFLRRCCQAMLAEQWKHQLPIIQTKSPAVLAATILESALDKMTSTGNNSKLTVIDFCAGGGGPTPILERTINAARAPAGKIPLEFLMSDLYPHIDAWMASSSSSDHLSFIPQPVDATSPPIAALSTESTEVHSKNGPRSDTRVFRLFCLAFHHFNNDMAKQVLDSTMKTSDGFAILELQDRRIGCLMLMLCNFFLTLLVTVFWFKFWHEPLQILFTYVCPILPVVLTWDGIVSCLRTREFEEVMRLVQENTGPLVITTEVQDDGVHIKRCNTAEWVFEGGRRRHTFPFGYLNWVTGRKVSSKDSGSNR
ncbi:hypothetical protein AOQ84DRAFT_357031 [Glonium stellatum]|uniref:Uncharacterized protein n=1 Tax=Glonium stellatum TaxID=574774 RepID=A0A8E2JNF9_9PEZI|nr:hypothetical protein AOQ84DRAFT_357031 [Glonium stellatum]